MSTQVAESVEDLFDGQINVNEPLTWEFLGETVGCSQWSRWNAYTEGDCAQIPNGEVWCASRNVMPGEVGPGEVGWKYSWTLKSSTMLGADHAAEAAHAQRHHGRGGSTLVGALVADFQAIKAAYRDAAAKPETDVDVVGATQKIIERARDDKAPTSPPARVTHYDETDAIDISPVQLEILGVGQLDEADFPLVSSLYKHFQSVGGTQPKFVRLDNTYESYLGFRDEQSPDLALLRRKMEALDALVRAHMADGHGAQDIIVGLASEVSELQKAAAGKRVPLQMPPWAEGTWDCWREDGPDGGMICCSIALPGHDGCVKICTAAAPVKPHVDDVVGYAADVGCHVGPLLGVLPTVACMLAGGSLMTEMAAAAPAVLAHPAAKGDRPFIGRIVPANQPTLAALMALLQAAQAGNGQAITEWTALSEAARGNADLSLSMSEARRRLVAAQQGVLGWACR